MQGVYRYKVRGLTAGSGVFTSMMTAQGMYVATAHRMLPGFFKILGGMAKFSKDPSTAEILDFFRSGTPGVDLSTIPVSAGLDVEVEFTLEQAKKEWRLKRGSYRWSSDAHFSFSAGEGQITENVKGQGSGALDPTTSSISLVTTGKRGALRSELNVEVPIPGNAAGKSVITNGPIKIAFDYRGDKVIMEVDLPGLAHHREVLGGGLWGHQISFSKSGPPERVIKGQDTYQDLLDSHVVEEWELWDECTATIESPSDNERMVYNLEKPARLLDTALANISPSFWENELSWLLPEISGSLLDPPRLKRNGNDFDIVYTHLPEKNSAFDFREVVADFSDRAKAAGCKNPKLTKVGYFFPRTGYNNPGPSAKAEGNPEMVVDPNWFFYWGQTDAAQGRSAELRYGGTAGICSERRVIEEVDGKELTKVIREPVFGYAPWGKPYVVICNLEVVGFTDQNPYTE
ncbi:MAG TPA: hypothetical protein VGQ24_05105, partial [Gemmatimonadales bacterium]|nr:hypothetical protein [Gemmatimonadales bacterium]